MKNKYTAFAPGVLWMILIYVLLTLPGSDIPQSDFFDLVYFDKWVHIGLFGMLVILWCLPFILRNIDAQKLFLKIALAAVVYGVLMEYVQKYFTIDRTFDYYDMLADGFGSITAFFVMRYWSKKRALSGKKNKPL